MIRQLVPLNAEDFDRLPADMVGVPVFYRSDENPPKNGALKVWPKPNSWPAVNTAARFAADVVPMKE